MQENFLLKAKRFLGREHNFSKLDLFKAANIVELSMAIDCTYGLDIDRIERRFGDFQRV